MNLKIAICDDEPIICQEIEKKLLTLRPGYQIDIFHSGKQLLAKDVQYDFIFLDIEMPELNGLETAQKLRKREQNEYIIFLTSHTELMAEGYKVKAFRFLRKPISDEDFREAVEEIEKEFLENEKIILNLGKETRVYNLRDIVCFEAFGDGTYIHTKTEVLESNKTLKYWMETMGTEHFYQVNKSYFIAFRFVEKIEGKMATLSYMKEPISVSRRKITDFKETFWNYITQHARIM